MVLFVMPKPLSVGQTYKAVKSVIAGRSRAGLTDDREAVEVDVLADVVDRDIEARRVGQVEDIHADTSTRSAR